MINEIFLSTHKGMACPSYFDVVSETEKALKLKHESTGKTVWLPKSVIKWDDTERYHYLSDGFRRKMPVWQLSLLQG